MKEQVKVQLPIPKGMELLSIKLCMCTTGDDIETFSIRASEEGAGPYVEFKTEEQLTLSPEELAELHTLAQGLCKLFEK